MKMLQSPIVGSVLGLVLYVVTTALLWKPEVHQAAVEEDTNEEIVARAKGAVPSWDYQNPDVDMMISELRKEKEALDKREKDLNALEERLKAERLEINVVTQAVYQMQKEFDTTVARIAADEAVNIKKLAKTYAAMTPEGAAAIMKELDDNTLVKILAVLKDSESAPVIELLGRQSEAQAKRMALITDRLRIFQSSSPPAKKGTP